MLRLLQMGPSKVLTTLLIPIQSSWQLLLLELAPCRITVTPSSDSSDMYTSTVQSSPASANAALSPHPRLQTSYPLSTHSISSPSAPPPPSLAPRFSSTPPASTLPMTLLGFFNGMMEVFEPGALNYSTFFRPILSTSSAFRNPILTHLPLSGFLDSLLCDLIVLVFCDLIVLIIPGLVFLSSDTTHAIGGVVIFVRQGLSFSQLSTSSLSSLDPYSDYVGINISLNNSSSVSFLNVYALPIRSSPTDGRTNSFSPSILPSSRNLFILGDFNCHHSLWDSRVTSDPRGEEVFDWVISSDLLFLNDPDTLTLLHRSSGTRSSPDISFAPSSLALSCSWEVLQDLGSDHLPILLSIPLSPVFRPNEHPPLPSTFRKLAGRGWPPTLTLTVPQQRNTRLFLFPLLLLSLPLWH